MAKTRAPGNPVEEKLDNLIRVMQDLFILQALLAGAKVDDVRKAMKIDKWRVSNINKYLKLKDAK